MQRFKYQALVTPYADDEGDARAKLSSGSHRMVLRVVGDDISDYLETGSHFSLWLGSDVGRGVVTRRLHL